MRITGGISSNFFLFFVKMIHFVFDLIGSLFVLNFKLLERAKSLHKLIILCSPDLLADRTRRSLAYPKQPKKLLTTLQPKPEALRILKRSSMYTLNRMGELTEPCLTPLVTENLKEDMPFHWTSHIWLA